MNRARSASIVVLVLLGAGLLPVPSAGQVLIPEADMELVPVLLVPGWGDQAPDNLRPLRDRLVGAGWPESRVSVLAFEDPVGSNEVHALEIARAVRVLQALTGESKIDVVAHSMGGLALRQYLQFEGGRENVRRAVFLGTPHRGTVAAMLAWGEGGREMAPGSDFLTRLNEAERFPGEVEALSVRTPVDLRVIPGSSAMLPGARNVEVCCPSHNGLAEDERVFEQVHHFLIHGADGLGAPDDTIPLRGGRGG